MFFSVFMLRCRTLQSGEFLIWHTANRAMSALSPKADINGRIFDVRFVPKADIASRYSITSSAMDSTPDGTSIPSARAVCRLIANTNLVDCSTGRSAGLAPLRMRPV
jgi:hypothetical protein